MNPLNPIERAKTIGEGNEPWRSRPGPIVYLEHMQYALCHAAPGLRYSPQRPIQPKTDVCRSEERRGVYSKNLCTIRRPHRRIGGVKGAEKGKGEGKMRDVYSAQMLTVLPSPVSDHILLSDESLEACSRRPR